MKKQSLLLVLALLLATLLLTVACGSTKTTTAPSVSTSSEGTSAQTPGTTTAPPVTTPTTTTAFVTTSKHTPVTKPVKLLTFNLRYDTTSHPCMALDVRGAHLMEVIKKYTPDSISFNEATNDWMNYLNSQMTELGYSHVSSGPSSVQTYPLPTGLDNRQQNPIFYQSAKYDLLESDTFWLSETPELNGSVSWDSSWARICTYAVLKNKESGAIYAHFGTHLDHVSEEARQNSILVIESYIRAVYKKYGEIGIVLSGDFNDINQSTTYKSILSFMDDASNLAETKLVVGATANGYSPDKWEEYYAGVRKPTVGTSSPIDYIFLGKITASVSLYTVVDDLFTFEAGGKTWTDHPISDHYGVFCEATFTAPTKNLTYDESKIVTHRAEFAPSKTLPSSYEGLPVINDLFAIKSTQNKSKPIENILKNDSSVGAVTIGGNKHGVWEITLTADSVINIKGLSFTTGTSSRKVPGNLRVYVSSDAETWMRLGSAYTDNLATSTTYYLSTPGPKVAAQYIKFVFSDCNSGSELVNLSVYGK